MYIYYHLKDIERISNKRIFTIYSRCVKKKILTSNLWSKSYLKDGKKTVFFKEISKSYMLSLKAFCHETYKFSSIYSPCRRADVFLHDIGDRG